MKRSVEIIIFSVFLLCAVGSFVFAQGLEIEYPEVAGIKPESSRVSLPNYVNYIFNLSLALSGVVVFLVIFYSGFRYFISTGDPAKKKDAADGIKAAFLGLTILLFSYLILTTINPQLIFLSMPERENFNVEELVGLEVAPPDTLFYNEMPLGGLIEELFLSERIKEIKEISQKVSDISTDLNKASQQLYGFAIGCSCNNCSPVCDGECGGGYCNGDPCPYKGEIYKKTEEIRILIDGKKEKEGARYWQEEIKKQIDDFKKVFDDLKLAENMVATCVNNTSANGRSQTLLTQNSLSEYERYVKDFQNVSEFIGNQLFQYVSSQYNPYLQASFYCAESLIQTNLIIEEIPEINPEEVISLPAARCGEEIKIGEAIDNAEELAQKILEELENINSNILKEIANAERLSEFSEPSDCVTSNCYTECIWVEKECCDLCPEEDEEGDNGDEEGEITDWGWYFWFLEPTQVFAAGEICCVDCSYCEILPCSGNTCPGDEPRRSQIIDSANQIQGSNSSISSSNNKIQDFFKEEIEKRLKISEIKSALDESQYWLASCYNSAEKYKTADLGNGTVLWKELVSCSFARESEFYPGIENCYGLNANGQESMDNFFCCFSELSPTGY